MMKMAVLTMAGVILLAGAGLASAADAEKGKEVFKAQKCSMCHSIEGVGNKKTPLDGVGAKLKPEEITKWITAPQSMKADVKKKAYTLPQAELDDLVAYLSSLKK